LNRPFPPLALALAALCVLPLAAQAQINPGVHAARATKSFDGVNGVGGHVRVGLPALPIDLFLAGEYFFPDCDNCSLWGGSVDVHLSLPIPVVTPYATAGLVMRNFSASDVTVRTGGLGFGAGVNLTALVVGAFAEGRYELMESGDDQLVFRLGIRF
jgi:hypothetical protein